MRRVGGGKHRKRSERGSTSLGYEGDRGRRKREKERENEGRQERDELKGVSEEDNAEWTEGMMKGAGCEGEESHGEGGWKRSKPPSLDGERRENEDGDHAR